MTSQRDEGSLENIPLLTTSCNIEWSASY